MGKRNDIVVSVKVTINVTTQERATLVFGKANAKLGKRVKMFSLPAGWACPFASECLSKADRETGKVKDGPDTVFRCFSASDEARHKSARQSRWHNFEALRALTSKQMADLIAYNLPKADTIRIHVSGDFFSLAYLDAWLDVARRRPDVRFYFYTKSVRYWVQRLDVIGTGHEPGQLPNVVPTASKGGKDDALIETHGLRSAVVVYSQDEADRLGLKIDHDDSHAMTHGGDFALLIHGTQPAGSEAAKAISALRAEGEYGYGKRADEIRAGKRVPLVTV